MSQILKDLYIAGGVVFLFGAAIFVHEFGHYWVARRRGMKVEAFAIGFGPKIFGWVRDGIEYSVRWIPAGGFVKLPQMVTSTAIEGEASQEEIPPAPPLSKILVAVAGPFMNGPATATSILERGGAGGISSWLASPSMAVEVTIWGSLTKPPAGIQRTEYSMPSRTQPKIFGPNPM